MKEISGISGEENEMQRNNFYSYTQKKLDLLTKNLLVIKRKN